MNQILTPQEIFAQASRNRASSNSFDKPQQGNFGSARESEYFGAALEPDAWLQFRVLGNPKDNRYGDPSSPRSVFLTLMNDDEGKFFTWSFAPIQDRSHWSWQIVDTVLEQKGRGHYVHEDKPFFPEVRFLGNPSSKYTTGWKPTQRVLMNVLVRERMKEHLEKGMSIILSRRRSTSGFYELGVPVTLYNMLWDNIVEHCGPWTDYDVVARRLASGEKPWYEIYHAGKEAYKLEKEIARGDFKYFKEYAEAPLTEEELSIKCHNLDEVYKTSSAEFILGKISKKIEGVDRCLGTHFIEMLRDSVSRETAQLQMDAERRMDEAASAQSTTNTQVPTRPVRPTRPQEKSESEFDLWDALAKEGYRGIDDMTPEEKAMAIGVAEDGSIKWAPDAGETYICPEEGCGFIAPIMHVCPKCGCQFDS